MRSAERPALPKRVVSRPAAFKKEPNRQAALGPVSDLLDQP